MVDEATAIPDCPNCGRRMVLRTARRGPTAGAQFWGCVAYPECRGSRGASDDAAAVRNASSSPTEPTPARVVGVINRISRLRAPGVFHDFRWATDLPDFGRYNLIYGWNGSGKTTISRLLRSLETRTDLPTDQAVLRIRGTAVKGEEFASSTTPVRVFNRDFVNESVLRSGGSMRRIFVVGKESAEKQRKIDDLSQARDAAQERLEVLVSEKRGAETALDKFCIAAAKRIKEALRSSDANPYNNYDKARFHRRAEKMLADRDRSSHRLKDAERASRRAQLQATPKEVLSEVTYRMPAVASIAEEVAKLLSSTVVASAIESLAGDPTLTEWTRTGLHLHSDRGAVDCLFCRQRLPEDRLGVLEAHFNAEYERLMRDIDSQIDELQSAAAETSALELPNTAELHQRFGADYETAAQSLRDIGATTRTFLQALIGELEKKKERPFISRESAVPAPSIHRDPVEALNAVIDKHNEECEHLQSRVDDARSELALDMIAADLDEFVSLRETVRRIEGDIGAVEAELSRLAAQIDELEREISEYRRPAEELNADLSSYLGHDELRVDVRDTGYTISRGNKPAESLSEGEITAIALLYFLKSLEDTNFTLSESAVVLDDPVSSLDANALYLAFGFIQERTKDCGQLFILTHNFTFFRQVRNWFHQLKGQRKKDVARRPARFYMLDCTSDGARRSSALVRLDPLLERYESDYHYMFSQICRAADAGPADGFEQNYFLPNMARRVLEAFLAFRQPNVAGDLRRRLEEADFDEAKKRRIIRFVHAYSHSDTVGEPQHDASILGETHSVLNDLLAFIESQDPGHFTAMKALVETSEAEEDSA